MKSVEDTHCPSWTLLSLWKIPSITVLLSWLYSLEYSQNVIQQRKCTGRKLSQESGGKKKKQHNQPLFAVWCDLVLIIRGQYSNFVSQAVDCLSTAVNGWVDLPKSLWYPVSYSGWGCPKSTLPVQRFWLDHHIRPAIHMPDKRELYRF